MSTQYKYEDVIVNFDEENAIDITNDIKYEFAICYKNAVKKVLKQEKLYKVIFNYGYTAFGQESRFARRKAEVKWYSRVATEERAKGTTFEEYKEEFIRKNIDFDGERIPVFIDKMK